MGSGACGAEVVGEYGGGLVVIVRACYVYVGCLLIVGESEEESEVTVCESAVWVVLVESGDARYEWLAQCGVGVVGCLVVDDVGDEAEG